MTPTALPAYIRGLITDTGRELRGLPTPLIAITALGLLARLTYVLAYPPVWKMAATFNVFEFGVVEYLSDFAGYKPSRMPFFDAFSAMFYPVFGPLLGVEALLLFNFLLAIVAIPAFYIAVERLWSREVAVPASLLFALYPKYVLMTSTGLPEAAAISFLALALYTFARTRSPGRLRAYFATGVFAMLAYIMFVPAVAVGVLLGVFIYVSDVQVRIADDEGLASLLPTTRLTAFASIPGVVGVAYLLFGPLSETLADVSPERLSVFVNPETYSLVEKTFWYLAYTFFDFWWHTRGFDRERGIQPLIESLQGFLGPLFPVYLLGWGAITLAVTATMVVGIGALSRRRSRLDLLVISWIVVYIVAYNYKNLGWVGGFQTRHVSAVFPALCLAFGIGVWKLSQFLMTLDLSVFDRLRSVRIRTLPLKPSTVVATLFFFGIVVLLLNGIGQGVIEQEKTEASVAEPAREVSAIVGEEESVAVVWPRNFHNLVLYSKNRVRPTLLVDSDQRQADAEARYRDTVEIQQVSDPLLRDADATYLYLHVEPAYIDRFPYTVDINQSQIDHLLDVHTVIYHKHVPNDAFRTTSVDIYLLRLENE